MAKITRKLNTKQRDAMIRRKMSFARDVAKKPSVSTIAEGFHAPNPRRSSRRWKKGAENKPVANIVIVRTQNKRGNKIRATAGELKAIYNETFDIRELMLNGTVKPAVLLKEIGKALKRNARNKVQQRLATKTGDLHQSISFKVKA